MLYLYLRRFFVTCSLCCLAATLCSGKQPNVVFILSDDLGWGDLSSYGHPHLRTTNFDRLAKEGMRLNRFYVASPVCSPTRASLLTGVFAPELGIHYAITGNKKKNAEYNTSPYLDPALPNLYHVFRQAGYTTAHFGKWHIGNMKAPAAPEYGLDVVGITHGPGNKMEKPSETLTNHNKSEILFNRAIEFVEDQSQADKPFFLSLWMNDPHSIIEPTPKQMAPYMKYRRKELSDRFSDAYTVYYAIVGEMDKQFGRFMERLDALGLSEDTIIVFTSDNGPSPIYVSGTRHSGVGRTGPFRGYKSSLYEGGIRVPFIIRWPGHVPANTVDDNSAVNIVDMLPTLTEMAGVDLPSGIDIDGVDRSSVFAGQASDRSEPMFWEFRQSVFGPHLNKSPRLAMMEGDWKLLINPDGSRSELYNLAADLSETTTPAGDYTERVERMTQSILAWYRTLPDTDAANPNAGIGPADYPMPKTGDL